MTTLEHSMTISVEQAARVLAPPGQTRAAGRPASGFLDHLNRCGICGEAFQAAEAGEVTGLALLLRTPGGLGMIMVPRWSGELRVDHQREVIQACIHRCRQARLYYAQVLLEPDDRTNAQLLLETGFRRLTRLLYLEADLSARAARPAERPTAPVPSLTWLSFSPDTREAFAETLLASYQGSLDCPELTGLRPIDAVIESHQAAGPFDPGLWELAQCAGQPVGCVLLSRTSDPRVMELVYVSVRPEWRGRGLGAILVDHAMQQCRLAGARRMVLAVDERNHPARAMYARAGLRPIAAREAFVFDRLRDQPER